MYTPLKATCGNHHLIGGKVKMGRGHHGQDLYAWDNEFGSEVKVRLQ